MLPSDAKHGFKAHALSWEEILHLAVTASPAADRWARYARVRREAFSRVKTDDVFRVRTVLDGLPIPNRKSANLDFAAFQICFMRGWAAPSSARAHPRTRQRRRGTSRHLRSERPNPTLGLGVLREGLPSLEEPCPRAQARLRRVECIVSGPGD